MHVNSVVHHIKNTKKLKFLRRQNFYEFLKNRLFRKRQAETKTCVFLLDHRVIPYIASSGHFATANSHLFRTLPVWMQTISITRYSWEKKTGEKNHSQKCYQKPLLMSPKNWKLWNYRTSRFVYTVARRYALVFPHCLQYTLYHILQLHFQTWFSVQNCLLKRDKIFYSVVLYMYIVFYYVSTIKGLLVLQA